MSTAWYAGKGYEAVKGAVEDPDLKCGRNFAILLYCTNIWNI
ncbi:MAG: hypothetical protein ACLVG5_07360 [Clostridium sp.]